ncbi:MAG: Rv3654c family TadE-like protein [Ornithinimicrobium sp.]
MRRADIDQEQGSATVLALGVLGVVISLMVAVAVLGAVVAARQQAQLAADLGAVAGAQFLRSGVDASAVCGRASRFVKDNGAQMEECAVRTTGTPSVASSVLVTAGIRLPVGSGWTARASARAGLTEP